VGSASSSVGSATLSRRGSGGVPSGSRSGGVASVSGGLQSSSLQSRALQSRSSAGAKMAALAGDKVVKEESEWKKELSAAEYNVIRGKGTERAFTGEYDKFFEQGGYFACKACKNPLYSAQSKFDSGCGWPAFDRCYKGSVATHVDNSFGMRRVEIVCARCEGHLGHVFTGEHKTATNERHCVNSVSVKFVKGESPVKAEEVLEGNKKALM
jgi:peptide-methionine (R)-S-oxide reductase